MEKEKPDALLKINSTGSALQLPKIRPATRTPPPLYRCDSVTDIEEPTSQTNDSYWSKILEWLPSWCASGNVKTTLFERLAQANSASEWQRIARKIDRLAGNEFWREDALDSRYDHKLIFGRLCELRTAREIGNRSKLSALISAGSLRNLGSICNTELYNHAYGGTKNLIEEYIAEMVLSIHYLAEVPDSGTKLSKSEVQKRLEFFHDTSQSLGRSALVLHGGALFGLCHLGTLKGLQINELLPHVIVGVAVGAVIAALACSVPESELLKLIDDVPVLLPESVAGSYGKEYLGGVAQSVFRTLVPPEVQLLVNYTKSHLGDQTFEELFAVSGRTLNITVTPDKQSTKDEVACNLPSFIHCNYLTTPNMLVRSAMMASIGTNNLPDPQNEDSVLLVKDYKGDVVTSDNSPRRFRPANQQPTLNSRRSPYVQLAELFNVNNFIVSISRPYLAPMLLSEFKYRGEPNSWRTFNKLLRTVLTYRLSQLSALRLLPQFVQRTFVDETIQGGFQVNIVPEPESILRDFALLLDSNNIRSKAAHWIEIGERSVWPMLSIIKARMAIEVALIQVFDKLKGCA